MSAKRHIIFLVVAGIVLFAAFTLYSFKIEINKKRLPVIGQVNEFSLINEKGEPYSLKDLRQKVWVASFFFTTCSDICPMMTKNMAALNRTFEGVDNVRLVSISVNPETDTSSVLADYARKHGARENWVFLTGDRTAITELAVKSFKLGSIEEPVFHSSYFTLVDRGGLIRGYYDGTDREELNRLYQDAAHLIKQKSKM
jgi:protein SCO1/2